MLKKYSAIIGICVLLFYIPIRFLSDVDFSNPFDCEQNKNALVLDGKISQGFHAEKDGLSAVSFKTATFGKTLFRGFLTVDIKNESSRIIFSKKISPIFIGDNRMRKLKLPKDLVLEKGDYTLELSPGDDMETIALWSTEKDCYAGTLKKGGRELSDSDLILHQHYRGSSIAADFETFKDRSLRFEPVWLGENSAIIIFAFFVSASTGFIIYLARKIF